MPAMLLNTFAIQEFPQLILRAAQEADQTGIAQLYHSSRQDLQALPMPREMIADLIRQQQKFQEAGFAHHYPQAQTLVLATPDMPPQQGQVLARMVLDQSRQRIHLIDIMVHPMVHRRGLARQLLRYLQDKAKTLDLPVSLQVMKDNQSAFALYTSCSFQITSEDYLEAKMQWLPSSQHSTQIF